MYFIRSWPFKIYFSLTKISQVVSQKLDCRLIERDIVVMIIVASMWRLT
jgi:hypothetical protein